MVDTNKEIVMEEVSDIKETREDIEQIVNEPPIEPVKMKKPRANAKPKEPTITKEDIMEAVKEATKKPIPDKVDKNKEMVECPDCGLKITYHNLRYTHKRYCKALKEQEVPASSSTEPIPIAPKALPLVREKRTTDVDDVNEFIKNNPEVITNYLRNERANKANKRQINAKSLLSNAF
jgi:DNA-directed RNA polymerase subunit RPC12/RpoP